MTCLQTWIFNTETEGPVWSTRIKSSRTTRIAWKEKKKEKRKKKEKKKERKRKKRRKTHCLFLSTWILFSVFSTVSVGAKTVIVVRIKGMYLHWKNNLSVN